MVRLKVSINLSIKRILLEPMPKTWKKNKKQRATVDAVVDDDKGSPFMNAVVQVLVCIQSDSFHFHGNESVNLARITVGLLLIDMEC